VDQGTLWTKVVLGKINIDYIPNNGRMINIIMITCKSKRVDPQQQVFLL
jgi:hypothetical protein